MEDLESDLNSWFDSFSACSDKQEDLSWLSAQFDTVSALLNRCNIYGRFVERRPFHPGRHFNDQPYVFYRVRTHPADGEETELAKCGSTRFKSASSLWHPPRSTQNLTGRADHPTEAVLYLANSEQLALAEAFQGRPISDEDTYSIAEVQFQDRRASLTRPIVGSFGIDPDGMRVQSNLYLDINYVGFNLVEPLDSSNFEWGRAVYNVNETAKLISQKFRDNPILLRAHTETWRTIECFLHRCFLSHESSRALQSVVSRVFWSQGWVDALVYPSKTWFNNTSLRASSNFAIRETAAQGKLMISKAFYCRGREVRTPYPPDF